MTPDQAAAVSDSRCRLLLIAPAGSGKTEVLSRRIERILVESSGEAHRLLALTYTVKAAEELRSRLKEVVAEDSWRVDCDTAHGFAFEWLQRYGSRVGITPGVTVFSDDPDRLSLIAGYLRSLGEERAADSSGLLSAALSGIDAWRTNHPREVAPDSLLEGVDIDFREMYDAYSTALENANGIDFPGMLIKLLELFDADPWVLENFQRTYRHVLVDEGQDLTAAQSLVIERLASDRVCLFVVADERQSINEFAGGSFGNARRLIASDESLLRLHNNFRCSVAVLEAAERISLPRSGDTQAIAPGAPRGSVTLASAADQRAEAEDVVNWVEELLQDGLAEGAISPGEDPHLLEEDVAVIARTRWLLESVVNELRNRGRRVSLHTESSGFLATAEARLFLETLSLLTDSENQPARRRFLEELSGLLGEDAEDRHPSDPILCLERSGVQSLLDLAQHLALARSSSPNLDVLLGELGDRFIHSNWGHDAAQLSGLWTTYRSNTIQQQRTTRGYLLHVDRSRLAKPSDPGVRVLTIHRVKGLEFRAVAIVGVFDGALPDYRAKSKREIEAERRSLYVAMTRAQRALRVTWPRSTLDRWNRAHAQLPSRFLTEAGLLDQNRGVEA